MDTNKELNHLLFVQRENDISHSPYEHELNYYEVIKAGNVEALRHAIDTYPIQNMAGRGILSQDPLRNIVYHTIISAAMIARFCIEGGLHTELAYGLSDIYIQMLDKASAVEQVAEIHKDMCIDYAKRMKALRNERIYAKQIVRCIDFIYENLQKRITVDMLARHVALNRSYLSRLFLSQTGRTISEYIRDLRIEAAQNMLKFSDYSCLNIANYLAFSSQSHFILVFRKRLGVTPEEYRKKHFRRNWTADRMHGSDLPDPEII